MSLFCIYSVHIHKYCVVLSWCINDILLIFIAVHSDANKLSLLKSVAVCIPSFLSTDFIATHRHKCADCKKMR